MAAKPVYSGWVFFYMGRPFDVADVVLLKQRYAPNIGYKKCVLFLESDIVKKRKRGKRNGR